ncbi:AIPR family protein [Brevibacterium aurantiacum]|uniref:Abortive phage infection protein C-terminal domain-containing protein n=1 Tax=Brevibacterium aurantiacum TaxID=273384 RepID=A0A2A3ZBM2_BREAU|nr:AIPR family protein [Brevibacterium aurantiacum]PCC48897.1 hypothetical protein CIK62_16225 [Brevibacterium aurantiacum]
MMGAKPNPDEVMAKHAFEQFRRQNYPDTDPDVVFEYFSNHLIAKHYGLTSEEERGAKVGDTDDGGIDSILILLNKTEVVDGSSARITRQKNALQHLTKNVPLDIFVIQSKNSHSWKSDVLSRIGDTLDLILDTTVPVTKLRQTPLNEDVVEMAEVYRKLTKKLIGLTPNQTFSVKYVSLGSEKNIATYQKTKATTLKNRLRNRLPSNTKVSVDYFGAESINTRDKESTDFDVTLKFAKPPVRDGNALIGLVKLREYAKFLRRPKTEMLRDELFVANVRDYAGPSVKVNAAIGETLRNDGKSAFWWLNNGVTIIVDDSKDPLESNWVLTNPLIVNGLQTSHVIHEAAVDGSITNKRLGQCLLVRVIKEPDADVRESVITGTNNQTAVSSLQLHANDSFQRRIEDYLASKGWYYERRRYQYRGAGKPAGRVRTFKELAQAVISVHLLSPDTARARPGTQLSEDSRYSKVFGNDLPLDLFNKSLLIMDAIESYLQSSHAKQYRDTSTNTRFYLASGYVISSLKLRNLDSFDGAITVGQLKTPNSVSLLEDIHKVLDKEVQKLDDGKIARDKIYKGKELKHRFFDALISRNQK